MANPVNDMYADAVLAVILQVESNPTTAQGKLLQVTRQLHRMQVFYGLLASSKNRMQLSSVNSGPFRRYGGHLEFCCFQ